MNLTPKLMKLLLLTCVLVFVAVSLGPPPATASSTTLVINEIDYDQPSTDAAEFVEIKNVSGGTINLDGYTLELVNGTGGGAAVYNTIDLPNIDLGPGDYYVVCGNAANVPNCDLDVTPDTNLIQNGAPDGVGLRLGGTLVDAASYEGDTGAPYTEGSGAGLEDDSSVTDGGLSRCPDGADTDQNNVDFSFQSISPGAANNCGTTVATGVIINEVDADQDGTDSAEFIELYDGGSGNTDLSGLVIVLFNGANDASYDAFDLVGQSTDSNGYFVLCGNAANVPNCDLDVTPDTNLIQNGADAVALYVGNAGDFPGGTPVTTTNLLDAIVYDTNDDDDPGLLVLLNAGQPQVNEAGAGNSTGHSNQRCPNGSGGQRNTESYAQFPPTPGAENSCGGGGGAGEFGQCGDPATLIHDIQGNGPLSPLNGATGVVIEGVVVGDYQLTTEFRGFHVQEEDTDADADPATSEGIFVFDNNFGLDVAVGDVVRVQGNVSEFETSSGSGAFLTELSNVSNVAVCSSGNSVTPATVNLPVNNLADWEQFEGMLVHIPQELTVTENFTLGRFGEVSLSVGGRLFNPTNVTSPGAAANALQDLNDRSRIVLDDGNGQQNIDPTRYPAPGLSAANTLRSGYTVNGLTGVLEQRFSLYRVQPVGPVSFNADNPRPASPEPVGGTLKVASFNVLNYFTTLDTGVPICGPASNQDCRGADSAFEFTRQRDKIISALTTLDADVIGLMEIENHPGDVPIADLVSGLNDAAGAGTYDYIATGAIGTDAIRVGLIFKPGSVTPTGAHAILDSSVDPAFNDAKNRPALAQTFEQNVNGQRFTVVVNHLKSKGSDCNDVGDPDTGDGQGNCNLTRTNAAIALVNWLATDPTGSGDSDVLIIGDLNSYALEDPITAIKNGGYTNLIESFVGGDAYSFVFDGQSGYLDHALANSSLTPQVTGVTEWHINADEPIVMDYNVEFKSANHVNTLYDPGPYRASDHDPVIVGLCQPPALEVSVSPDMLWPPNHKYVPVNASANASGDAITVSLLSVTSNEPDDGLGDGDKPDDIVIVDDFSFKLRAERAGDGDGRVYTITYEATNSCGSSTVASATVTVPHDQGGEESDATDAASVGTEDDTASTDTGNDSDTNQDITADPAVEAAPDTSD